MGSREARRGGGVLMAVAGCVLLSGAASLCLEVVWSRLLKLIFGSTTLAVTTILVAYMLGLGLGGLFGGRLAGRIRNGVRVYGIMEVAVGLYAFTVPWILGGFPWLNRHLVGSLGFWPAACIRFVVVLFVLLLPTLMMGATLPVLIQALVRGREQLSNRVGLLYGTNTLGAMAGVLVTTFVLFPWLGLRGANFVGACGDILVGLLAWFVVAPLLSQERATRAEIEELETTSVLAAALQERRWNLPLLTYGLVGFTALTFEVSWTRALSLILGSSIYAFATMLAGFLAGIALGSLIARRWLDRLRNPSFVYAIGLALLGCLALATMLSFRALPDLFLSLVLKIGISGSLLVRIGLAISFLVMLGPTLVLGALFPLAVRTGASHGRSLAGTVGDVYFVNTMGSASGAFAAGFLLIPHFGLHATMVGAVVLNLATAAILFVTCRAARAPLRLAAGFGSAALAVWLVLSPPSWNAEALAVGVYYRPEGQLDFGLETEALAGIEPAEMLFYEEGINTTVSIHRTVGIADGGISMRVNGKADASLADMSTQVLSGHLPILFGGAVKKALVIGYASGVTTGSAALHGLERVDVVEIEPAVIEASHFFDDYNNRPLERSDVRSILDDGRTYLSATDELYDVIISEPSNPWITGCSNLFTAEFFEAARSSLNPGGRLLQWIQLYGMKPEGLQSILAALKRSFPYAYGFLASADRTDLLVLASDRPLTLDLLPRWEDLSPEVRSDLMRVENFGTADLWSLLVLDTTDIQALAEQAEHVNTDDTMFVELHAPWHLYEEAAENIELVKLAVRGVLPLADGEETLPPELLGELGLAYRNRRLRDDLAQACIDRARTRAAGAAVASVATYEAEEWIESGAPEAASRALALLDEALVFNPGSFVARHRRAWILCQERRYTEALPDLTATLRLRPDALEVRHLRLKALGALGRLEDAQAEVDFLLSSPLVETQPRLRAEAAFFAAGRGRFEEADREMRRYLALEPNSPREWSMLAQIYETAGFDETRIREAKQNADRAFRNQVIELHRAARWQERFASAEEAVRTLEVIRRMDPDYAEAEEDLRRLRETQPD